MVSISNKGAFCTGEKVSGNIGKKIRKLRRIHGLSQEELADEVGVARQTVSKWEINAMRPTAESIEALCKCFNVNPDYFFSDEDDSEQQSEIIITEDKKSEIEADAEQTATANLITKLEEYLLSKRNVVWLVFTIIASVILVISVIIGIMVLILLQVDGGEVITVTKMQQFILIISLILIVISVIVLSLLLIFRRKK